MLIGASSWAIKFPLLRFRLILFCCRFCLNRHDEAVAQRLTGLHSQVTRFKHEMQRDRAAHAASERAVAGGKNSGCHWKGRVEHLHFQASFIRSEAINTRVLQFGFNVSVSTSYGEPPATK